MARIVASIGKDNIFLETSLLQRPWVDGARDPESWRFRIAQIGRAAHSSAKPVRAATLEDCPPTPAFPGLSYSNPELGTSGC